MTVPGNDIAATVATVMATLNLDAAAVWRHDIGVVSAGAIGKDEELAELASRARQIFRQTHPVVTHLHLEFASTTLSVVMYGEDVLLLRSSRMFALTDVVAALQPIANGTGSRPRPATPHGAAVVGTAAMADGETPVATPTGTTRPRGDERVALEAVNLVVTFLRNTVGGPVLRNYLKKSRVTLLDSLPNLASYDIDLRGEISLAGGGSVASGAELGSWLATTWRSMAAVAAVTATTSIREITRALDEQLTPIGFYGGPQ